MTRILILSSLVIFALVLDNCMARDSKWVTYRGQQSYPGYRQTSPVKTHNKPARPPRPAVPPRADIRGVKLYGPRRNEKEYREGLSELAGLMDM
ncbi:hypothetical protein T265_09752 [Opisthorchis viverrini]|uniref:Uncharacterized protein n=1 Tax=Opisthorchis viverrini TaxID=6198 RepID=A0A074ZFQ3_OPIVI|nr:hypothetical protein T265_09752 [Opisthorchis viverrini]KER22065.1 hypothetical protein T265_09752 [Opisthorchis viverrini]